MEVDGVVVDNHHVGLSLINWNVARHLNMAALKGDSIVRVSTVKCQPRR
jgi:hypothetical protein